MKNVKIIKIIVFLIFVLMCVSCRKKTIYDFMQPVGEIENISVAKVSVSEKEKVIQEVVEIESVDFFLEKFLLVDCFVWYGDPVSVTDSDIPLEVIKIEYKNGEYELINWNGQSEYRVDRGFKWYAGFYVFDENEFQRLIEVLLSQ